MQITAPQFVRLRTAADRLMTRPVAIDPYTDSLRLRILHGRHWKRSGAMRASLVLTLDGQEYRASGVVSGGNRPDYQLLYRVPTLMRWTKGVPGAERVGQAVQRQLTAHLEFEHLRGEIDTELLLALSEEALTPDWPYHNSVAFDAATSGWERNGDGTLQVSHTSTGTNRAVRVATLIVPVADTSTVTYGGAGLTAEHATLDVSGVFGVRAWYGVGQATGVQTVQSAGSGDFTDHGMSLVSLTGVDQTTPVGTTQTTTALTTGSISVTVAGLVTDGMVVDCVGSLTPGGPTAGANQTERNDNFNGLGLGLWDSTQSSNDGGVMSWTDGNQDYWGLSAVEFKPAGGGGASLSGSVATTGHGITGPVISVPL